MLSEPIIGGGLAFGASLLLVPATRWLAVRNGWISAPRADRWSTRPVALFGGVAILAAYLVPILVFVPFRLNNSWSLIAAGIAMFTLGLLDDILHIKPATKLIGQIIGASIAVYLGHNIQLQGLGPLNVPFSIFWIVAVSNAYNLIDNMDGLAAGVGVIALAFMAATIGSDSNPTLAVAAFSLIGSLLGFLVFNFNSASIFMGDAGSMFVGLTMSVLGLHIGTHGSSLAVVTVPFLVLLVPILDMALVSATRILTGRSVAQGGRDHSSHRLVSLGLSERSAVLLLYGLAATAGFGALSINHVFSFSVSLGGIATFGLMVLAFAVFGVYLSQMTFDHQPMGSAKKRSFATQIVYEFAFKRRLLEVALDTVIMVCSYMLAHSLRFDFDTPPVFVHSLTLSLPLVVVTSFICFFATGVYRGIWQFTGPREIAKFFIGSMAAAIVSVFVVVSIYRFDGFSRSIFPLYGLLLFVTVTFTRLSFRFISSALLSLRPEPEEVVKVVIYGAGIFGEMLVTDLRRQNGHALMKPVGFLDDNEQKRNQTIHGVSVLGGAPDIERVFRKTPFHQVALSSSKISEDNLQHIKAFCRERSIPIKRYFWTSEDIA